jgi:hypothetical protein
LPHGAICRNDPINNTDPLGLDAKKLFELVEGVKDHPELTAEIRKRIEAEDKLSFSWSTMDVGTCGIVGHWYLTNFKDQFVRKRKATISLLAKTFDIPEVLLAGVAWNEVGGKPTWTDSAAHGIRSLNHVGDPLIEGLATTKIPERTSFGNVSMQIGRAAETQGDLPAANVRLSWKQRSEMIRMLEDDLQNLYLAAKHLGTIRDKYFAGKSATDLTERDIAIVGTRYNRGIDRSEKEILENTSYGDRVLENRDRLRHLLQ